MVKYIYKGIILLFVFVGALFFFGSRLETNIRDTRVKVDVKAETYPVLQVETQGQKINMLYGYSAKMEAGTVRESITPINQDKKITIHLKNSPTRITKLSYQILDKESGEVYDEKTLNAIQKNQKKVEIVFDYNFRSSTEYILDLQATTSEGIEIHYYTRIKYYLSESYLAQKLDFVKTFHTNTFNKNDTSGIEPYLEPSADNLNNTLAKVDITSHIDLITWGGITPEIVSDVYVTVKEYNMETACVQYNYFAKAKIEDKKELYHVKEFYRVRYVTGQNYLLNFERTLETEFAVEQTSVNSSQLKLGITNQYESKLKTNKEGNKLYFARGGTLYQYDMKTEEVMKIYSAFSEKADYLHRAYNEQGIRLLDVDEEGNVYFCAYGYFPRGRYEGDVAVVLFEYTTEGELQEMVYMPISASYQQLEQDFEEYGYVSSRGIYYFTVANTVYSYNMMGKQLDKIAEDVKQNGFMTMENVNCYVWSSSLKLGYGDSITVFNLETDEKKVFTAPDKNTYIRLFGVIEDNFVYGYAKKKHVTKMKDGTRVVPCKELLIADMDGKILKDYRPSKRYVRNIQVNGNVINMTLCKRSSQGTYYNVGEDSILNQSEVQQSAFDYDSRVTTKALTEWYIDFPSSFEMKQIPKWKEGPKNIISSERAVQLEQPKIAKYYVYALGKITEAYESAGKAIRAADEQMGVVISSNHQVVWERSGSFTQNSIGGLQAISEKRGISNLAACVYIVLKGNQMDVSAQDLTKENKSIYDMLGKYLERPMNLKGCSLEQVLYFVSNNKAVIAMTGSNRAVVIGGYTGSTLQIYDPATGQEKTVSRSEYEEIFKEAGNRFISFMES